MSNQHVEQIRNRLNISNLVSRYVTIKHKGNNEYLGLCPFHQEKSPSFTVSDEKRFFHCFGCGAHGDIFTFLMQIDNIGYREALEKLAYEANVELPKKNDYTEASATTAVYYQILEQLSEYYHESLFKDKGTRALKYLQHRNINLETIKLYRLGYATKDSEEVINFLKKEFTIEEIVNSGALSLSKNSNKLFNPFADRVIFPICDNQGRTIAFGGRLLETTYDNQPKYLNSAESILFTKKENLYGFHLAKKSISDSKKYSQSAPSLVNELSKNREIIVVEGYLDVLSLAKSGIKSVVAPLGTSISAEQIKILWQLSNNPTICLDNDTAGYNAMMRLAQLILPYIQPEKSLKFLKLNLAKDPDEIIEQKGLGEFLSQFNKNRINLADFLFQGYLQNKEEYNTPESKTHLLEQLNNLANTINHKLLNYEYKKYFYKLYKDNFYQFNKNNYLTAKNEKSAEFQLKNHIKSSPTIPSGFSKHIIILFKVLINDPHLLKDYDIYSRFNHIEIQDSISELRDYMISVYDNLGPWSSVDELLNNVNTSNHNPNLIPLTNIIEEILKHPYLITESDTNQINKAQLLVNAFKLHDLEILQKHIKEVELELQNYSKMEKVDLVDDNKKLNDEEMNKIYSRFLELKKHEYQLKLELNII